MQRYCPAFIPVCTCTSLFLFSLFSSYPPLSLSSYLQLFIKKHPKQKDVEKKTNETFSLLMSLPSSPTPFQIEKATKENPVYIS